MNSLKEDEFVTIVLSAWREVGFSQGEPSQIKGESENPEPFKFYLVGSPIPGDDHPMFLTLVYAEIERRWHAGESLQDIADALGFTRNALSSAMTMLRKAGYNLPHRNPIVAQARRKS